MENIQDSATTYGKINNCELFQVSWSNSPKSLITNLQKLRRLSTFCDCALVASGRVFFAHKIVLSSASKFLKQLLYESGTEHPTIVLAGVSADDLGALLEYVYNGQVKVNLKQMSTLLHVAQCLEVTSLANYNIKTDLQVMEEKSENPVTPKISANDLKVDDKMNLQPSPSPVIGQIVTLDSLKMNFMPHPNRKRIAETNVSKLITNSKRLSTYCPSEQPAICPFCCVVIRQGRNMSRHLKLKHPNDLGNQFTAKGSSKSNSKNEKPTKEILENITGEEDIGSSESDGQSVWKEDKKSFN